MATEVGVLREREIEARHYGSPNKLVEEDSSSRPVPKIFLAKGQGSAFPAVKKALTFDRIVASGGNKPAEVVKGAWVWKEKPASTELIHKTAFEWVNKCSKPAKEYPASRPCCKVCEVIGKIYHELGVVRESAACKICVVKAAALNRIKETGGDSAKEEGKAEPVGLVKASALAEKEVLKSSIKEGRDGKLATVVTVRVPYANIRKVMHLPPRTPLRPLPEEFKKDRVLVEATCAGAAASLSSIKTHENTLAQFFERGFATLELQVVEG